MLHFGYVSPISGTTRPREIRELAHARPPSAYYLGDGGMELHLSRMRNVSSTWAQLLRGLCRSFRDFRTPSSLRPLQHTEGAPRDSVNRMRSAVFEMQHPAQPNALYARRLDSGSWRRPAGSSGRVAPGKPHEA